MLKFFYTCRRAKNNNKGLTMVEIIVSITILAIIVIPVMTSFLLSSNANIKSKKVKDANDFAQQVVESLQSYKYNGVSNQFWNGQTCNFLSGGAMVTAPYPGKEFNIVKQNPGLTYGVYDSSFTSLNNVYTTTGSMYYSILNANVNNRDYDVQISYSPAQYAVTGSSMAYNLNQFPDLTEFNKSETAVINANGSYVEFSTTNNAFQYDENAGRYEGVQATSMENIVGDSFYNNYTAMYHDIITQVNEIASLDYNIDPVFYLKLSEIMPAGSKASQIIAIEKQVSKDTELSITYNNDPDPEKSGYVLSGNVTYALTNASGFGVKASILSSINSIYYAYASANLYDNGGNQIAWNDGTTEDIQHFVHDAQVAAENIFDDATDLSKLKLKYKVYNGSKPFKNLKNIYMMYQPLKNGNWKSDKIFLKTDISAPGVNYSSSNRLNLYLVPQVGLEAMNQGTTIGGINSTSYIKPTLLKGDIVASSPFDYSSVFLNYVDGYAETGALTPSNSKEDIVARQNPDKELLYQINVKVYEHASNPADRFSADKLLTELNLSSE